MSKNNPKNKGEAIGYQLVDFGKKIIGIAQFENMKEVDLILESIEGQIEHFRNK